MTALERRRRQYTWTALVAGLVVLAALPVLTVGAWRAIRDSRAAEAVVPVTTRSLPVTPTALLAAVDDDGELASIAVLALRPDGKGGTIVSVPVNAVETVLEELEPRPVGAGFAEGGLEQLVLDVESLMNVTIDVAGVVDAGELAGLLDPLGSLPVVLPDDVVDDGDVVAAAGDQTLTPEQAALALVATEEGVSEAARLPTAKAVWEAVAADAGDGVPGQQPAVTEPGVGAVAPADLASFVSALLAGPVAAWQLQYEPVGEGPGNPEGLDLMLVGKPEIVLVMATVAPSAVTAPNPGLTFQLDSSFGDAEVTKDVISWLYYFGGNVLLVRELGGTPPDETVLEYVFDVDRADLALYEWVLGDFRVERATERVEGIDIRIVLGKDFLDVLAERQPPDLATEPVATTSTPPDE
jgi:hypothetical protein